MSEPPALRLTYPKLAQVEPPEQGALLRLDGLGDEDRLLYRVLNKPEPDEDGTFTVELEFVQHTNE